MERQILSSAEPVIRSAISSKAAYLAYRNGSWKIRRIEKNHSFFKEPHHHAARKGLSGRCRLSQGSIKFVKVRIVLMLPRFLRIELKISVTHERECEAHARELKIVLGVVAAAQTSCRGICFEVRKSRPYVSDPHRGLAPLIRPLLILLPREVEVIKSRLPFKHRSVALPQRTRDGGVSMKLP